MRRTIALIAVSSVVALFPATSHSATAVHYASATEPSEAKALADGLLVTTDGPLAPAVLRAVSATLGRKIVGESSAGDSIVALRFDTPLPARVVSQAGPLLNLLGGISRVEPDLHATADAEPNDTYFGRQSNLSPGEGAASTGANYSIHAPAIWESTLGSKDVVVAVVDSGLVAHTDLLKPVVGGYDMIADERVSRDGNGRDSNASDPGTWSDGTYCTAGPSVWHGTHVAGIIAAKRNNGIGISGIAPGVTLQPVRVMGQCGGSMSDILAGIRWASGGTVPGVPVNKMPAKVINVSLSSTSSTCPSYYQDVIDEARDRGALVVVSAGNERKFVTTRTPANCDGVLSVGASAPDGRPTRYTNAGPTLGMMAPGGMTGEGEGIWSTIDSGSKGPSKSVYAQYSGTSMAAPTVAAAAALVNSLGTFTPAQVEQILKAAATRPPDYGGNFDCATYCGAGILNLANVPAPIGQPVLVGTTRAGEELSFDPLRWNGRPGAVEFQWLRDGAPISDATGTSYRLAPADLGHSLSVRSTAHTAGFPDVFGLSAPRVVPKASTVVLIELSAAVAKARKTILTAVITVSSQGPTPTGVVKVLVGGKQVATVDPGADPVSVSLPVFAKKGTFEVQAVYAGDGFTAPSKSPTVKVKVSS